MVATIQHRSDGTEPTNVYTVNPGGGPNKLSPSWWETLMEGCATGTLASGATSTTGFDAQVRAVTNALLAATRDMASNTGGVKYKPAV